MLEDGSMYQSKQSVGKSPFIGAGANITSQSTMTANTSNVKGKMASLEVRIFKTFWLTNTFLGNDKTTC